MPVPVTLLIIATLLPLGSFAVLVFVGKRMGNPLAGYVGTVAMAGSFVCSLLAVALCSYLLIGFWYERRAASGAAVKAFVTNRVGDVGLLVGLGMLFYHVGNLTLPNLWAMLGMAGAGQPVTLPNGQVLSTIVLTVMGVCLFLGAVGKSAQFPLHVWLPDA